MVPADPAAAYCLQTSELCATRSSSGNSLVKSEPTAVPIAGNEQRPSDRHHPESAVWCIRSAAQTQHGRDTARAQGFPCLQFHVQADGSRRIREARPHFEVNGKEENTSDSCRQSLTCVEEATRQRISALDYRWTRADKF